MADLLSNLIATGAYVARGYAQPSSGFEATWHLGRVQVEEVLRRQVEARIPRLGQQGHRLDPGRAGHFSCIVIPRVTFDVDTWHDGDPELAHYRMMQLLLSKRVDPARTNLIRLDDRNKEVAERLAVLRDSLNRTVRAELGIHYDAVRDVQAIDSNGDDLMQVAGESGLVDRDPGLGVLRDLPAGDIALRGAREVPTNGHVAQLPN